VSDHDDRRTVTTEARPEWLAGDPKPWQPEACSVVSDRLVFKPRLVPVA
jgi:hypothetical protein